MSFWRLLLYQKEKIVKSYYWLINDVTIKSDIGGSKMTKKDERKRSTYRFNQELEEIIKRESSRLGISKNAYVQTKLLEALKSRKQLINS